MLEYIISPQTVEKNPWDVLILGIIISSLSIWLGFELAKVLNASASILVIAITVIALAPLMHRILRLEEDKEESAYVKQKEQKVWKLRGCFSRHNDVLAVYTFLFIGLLISYSFWFVVLPLDGGGLPDISAFSEQEGAINAHRATGDATTPDYFTRLYENNIRVMVMCFAASFLFGAGALWIIAWNASVVAVFIGEKIKETIVGSSVFEAYLVGFPKYSLGLALWAIPEIGGYLIAGLAGGIVSAAVAKHHFRKPEFRFAVYDAFILLLLGVLLIIVGAWVEQFFVA
jgi:uncharacterized membrane protein YsdA (DUF1294 family)